MTNNISVQHSGHLRAQDLHYLSNKFFFIHCVLAGVRSLLLLGFVFYQFTQPLFLNATTWVFAYLFLFSAFSVDFVYFYFHEKIKRKPVWHWAFLLLDGLWITLCLSPVLPWLHSVLIFVYMLQIFSAGVMGHYKGAFLQGLWVSFLFSWILILTPAGGGSEHSLLFSFLLNNLGFMAVAGLSGFLGSFINKMKGSLLVMDKVFHQLEDLNDLIVKNINMGLFILNRKGEVIHSNKKALKLLGLSSTFSSGVGQVFPELKKHIFSQSKTKTSRLEVEYKDTKKRMEIFVSPIKNHQDGWKHLVLFQDCTSLRQRENKIKEAEKFAEIGKMADGIVREIKKPLSRIANHVQFFHSTPSSAFGVKRVEAVQKELSGLNGIIREFLDYTADEGAILKKAKREPINVNAVLEELLEQVHVQQRWGHITHHFILKSRGFIEANKERLKLVFSHVIKNACEAMEHPSEGAKLEVESFDDQGWVVVKIKDTGGGISAQDQPRVYEPFYSKKDSAGLGLPIVRKVVLSYKGQVSYENRPEGGTVCTLSFPINPNLFPQEVAQKKIA